ncbi:MAG: hypothetical protein ACOYOJ_07730, partial [Alsobacter sp.]
PGQRDEETIGTRRCIKPGLPRHHYGRTRRRRAWAERLWRDLTGALGQSRGAADNAQQERPTRQDGPRAHESPQRLDFAPMSTLRDQSPVRSSNGRRFAAPEDTHLPIVSNQQQSPCSLTMADSEVWLGQLLEISRLLSAELTESLDFRRE